MRKTAFIAVLTIGFSVIPFLIQAEVYKWIDDKGTIHFTDDYSNIPSSYREQLKVEIREDIQGEKTSSEPQKMILGSKEERDKTDLYRQEEEWWKGRARPWERQLKEASENYELTNKEFIGESSKLILRKFGSHQQFKSTIIGLGSIKEERTKYEAQIIEAEGMLEKISREAEKPRADLDRLIGVLTPYQEDIYGSNEAWWRQKLFTVREKLEDAIQDYKKSYEEYSKNVEKLGPYRFGGLSLTQYQLNSCRLEILDNEMAKYQAQIRQANEMLNKLLKEAEESKANPNWLQ
jgi:prefoldin subunit 5